jgi:hypothetical protein
MLKNLIEHQIRTDEIKAIPAVTASASPDLKIKSGFYLLLYVDALSEPLFVTDQIGSGSVTYQYAVSLLRKNLYAKGFVLSGTTH